MVYSGEGQNLKPFNQKGEVREEQGGRTKRGGGVRRRKKGGRGGMTWHVQWVCRFRGGGAWGVGGQSSPSCVMFGSHLLINNSAQRQLLSRVSLVIAAD